MFREILKKSHLTRFSSIHSQRGLWMSTMVSEPSTQSKYATTPSKIISNTTSFRGALMSKPHSFKSRDWRLSAIQTVDVLDGLGSSIKVYYKEFEVVKVLPNRNLELNERWISDKVRYFYDGLKQGRLRSPYIGQQASTWDSTLPILKSYLNVFSKEYGRSAIGFFSSSSNNCETMWKTEEVSNFLGYTNAGLEPTGKPLDLDFINQYQFNTPIDDLEDIDCCVFISTNPRYESANINLRLRKIFRRGCLDLWSLGFFPAAMFKVNFLEASFENMKALGEGRHTLCSKLRQAEKPVLICGDGVLKRWDVKGIQAYIASVVSNFSSTPDKSGNMLVTQANFIGGATMGFKNATFKKVKDLKVMYLIGGIEFPFKKFFSKNEATPVVACQYHHPLSWMKEVSPSVFLPTKTFVEEPGTYINMQGRVQEAKRIIAKQAGEGHELSDRSILEELESSKLSYGPLSTPLDTDNTFYGVSPNVSLKTTYNNIHQIRKTLLKNMMNDIYSSDPVSNSSVILSEASRLRQKRGSNYEFAF